MFNIETTNTFIFSFFIGLLTQFTNPVCGILKQLHNKRIRELLNDNLRFLIQNLLNQLLYYKI